jgi:hypothetical protein
MIRKFLRHLIGYEVQSKSDIQALIEFQRDSNAQYNEHIANLISTLDKIVTAKFDRPVIAEVKPNKIQPTFPSHALTDVLSYDDDDAFLEAVSEITI